jgi:hypothetical protein
MGNVSMMGKTAIFNVSVAFGAQAERIRTTLSKANVIRDFMEVKILSYSLMRKLCWKQVFLASEDYPFFCANSHRFCLNTP